MIYRANLLIWIVLFGLTACQATNDPLTNMRHSLAALASQTNVEYVANRKKFIQQYQPRLINSSIQQQLHVIEPLDLNEQATLIMIQYSDELAKLYKDLAENIPDKATERNRHTFGRKMISWKIHYRHSYSYNGHYQIAAWEYLWKEAELHSFFKQLMVSKILTGENATGHPKVAKHVVGKLINHRFEDIGSEARSIYYRWYNDNNTDSLRQ